MAETNDLSSTERLSSHAKTPFGRQMRGHFLFEDDFINLNHGSFGTYVRSVRARLRAIQDRAEAAPDRFIRYEYPELLDHSRQAMADFLRVSQDEIVFVPNSTTGINAVLRNLRFNEGDLIVYLDPIYGACEKTIDYIVETTPAESIKVSYNYPIDDDEIVHLFGQVLNTYKGRVQIALFETISSLPGVRLPFERLTEMARCEGVLSLIDGAHGVGHLEIDFATLQPDFFVSSCHKWLFVPRGFAVFYVPKRNQHLLRSSLPTSHYFVSRPKPGVPFVNNPLPPTGKSDFVSQFQYVGSVDNGPFLCLPEALRFRKDVCGGEQSIMNYCYWLAQVGGRRVAAILNTEVMDNGAGTLTRQCCMVNVRLPLRLAVSSATKDQRQNRSLIPNSSGAIPADDVPKVTQYLSSACIYDYSTFIAFMFYKESWWARLCAQIYLEPDDFDYGGRVIKQLCEKVEKRLYK